MDIRIGDKVRVRLRYERRISNVTITRLYPEYRYSQVDHNPWWIEGTTESGKTTLRFHDTEIVGDDSALQMEQAVRDYMQHRNRIGAANWMETTEAEDNETIERAQRWLAGQK